MGNLTEINTLAPLATVPAPHLSTERTTGRALVASQPDETFDDKYSAISNFKHNIRLNTKGSPQQNLHVGLLYAGYKSDWSFALRVFTRALSQAHLTRESNYRDDPGPSIPLRNAGVYTNPAHGFNGSPMYYAEHVCPNGAVCSIALCLHGEDW